MTGIKTIVGTLAAGGALFILPADGHDQARDPVPLRSAPHAVTEPVVRPILVDENDVIEEYCVRCHSDRRMRGNMSLEEFDAENPAPNGELAEKMIVKLRAGMMPPKTAMKNGIAAMASRTSTSLARPLRAA